MLNNTSKFKSFLQLKLPVFGVLVTSTILGLALVTELNQTAQSSTALAANFAQSNHPVVIHSQQIDNTLAKNTKKLQQSPIVNFPEQDGTYLYGQSGQPNQLGQGYIVFNKKQGRVTGALYMPSSEFSCFQGTIAKSGELAMTVTSSPGEVGALEVSTTSRTNRFNNDESTTYAHSLTLQNYHRLNSISANDRNILQMCSQEQ